MDFLDPRKKKAYHARLIVGYILVSIAIGLGAIILVYGAYGYGLNTKTGQIIQNGLLFVDSKPGGANIYLNDKFQNSTTSARLVLPADKYTLALKKSGYRDWQRSFTLDEHTIERYVYPLLVPLKPEAHPIKVYASQPAVITQSPDRRWLLVESPGVNPATISFDEYDTTNFLQPRRTISVPANLLTAAEGSNFKVIDWSNDNNHLLLEHLYNGGSEFIIFDRNNPANSVNLNDLFHVAPTQVTLRNKKVDLVYIYDRDKATLRLGDVGRGTLQPTLLTHVLAFKSNGPSLLTYVTDQKVAEGEVQARIWDNGKSYQLSIFKAGNNYLLDAAQFQGKWYYVVGSDTSDKINIYKDPEAMVRDPATAKAVPLLAFRLPGTTNVSFSTNTRFIGVEAGQSFGVYDLEMKERYQYVLPTPLLGPMHWMDGHRWVGTANNTFLMTDYDATNQQTLVPSADPFGGYFSRNYNQLFAVAPAGDQGAVVFSVTDLRAGADLPKP